MKFLNEHDLGRLHNVRDILEAIHNGTSSDFAENKHIHTALNEIEKAIQVNPKKSVFKF